MYKCSFIFFYVALGQHVYSLFSVIHSISPNILLFFLNNALVYPNVFFYLMEWLYRNIGKQKRKVLNRHKQSKEQAIRRSLIWKKETEPLANQSKCGNPLNLQWRIVMVRTLYQQLSQLVAQEKKIQLEFNILCIYLTVVNRDRCW